MAFDIASFYHEIILNRILSAAIIFFLGFIFGKIAGTLTRTLLSEFGFNRFVSKFFIARFNPQKIIVFLVSNSIYLAAIILALNQLGITQYVWKGIAILVLLLIILTILLDLKDLAPNIYAWSRIKYKKYFSANDRIKTPIAEGIVQKIGLLSTTIKTDSGDKLLLPNFSLLTNLSVIKDAKNLL